MEYRITVFGNNSMMESKMEFANEEEAISYMGEYSRRWEWKPVIIFLEGANGNVVGQF